MNLTYSGTETIPAPKQTVWTFITDPAKIAACMPDLISSKIIDVRRFDAVVGVAVGLVRGKFTFHVTLDPKPASDHLDMKITGGGFGSVVDLIASADVAEADGGTTLAWTGSATMRGPVATVGGRVIDAQAKRVIETTFANVKSRVTSATV
ncbi:MAG TPA: carbon monoxide dehydrogenase subunit G [Candidatus Limnocylindria bacterium]|jgi:carbon monoxide dehydrogenase subunit G|nr:carbon monoxide dehydrogenase subunit G [Candidatus Limnocylindria bacterium]